MRLLLARVAGVTEFDPRAWTELAPNASRADVANGDYLHDTYHGRVQGPVDAALSRLLRYDIFPPARMRAKVCTADGLVAVGATIVQRVRFGFLALETAVRVIECERSRNAARFVYATLAGHPERGIASFAVEQRGDDLVFTAEAWSRPGNILAHLGRPLARHLQCAITREAVDAFCKKPP